jgi:hypothetical protein
MKMDEKMLYNANILGSLLSTANKNGSDLAELRSNYNFNVAPAIRDIYPIVGGDFELSVTGY